MNCIASQDLLAYAEVGDYARREGASRVVVMLRHSMRPPLPPDDNTFGSTLGLTPEGEVLAQAVGRDLRDVPNLQFLSAPARRTELTAKHVAIGYGTPDAAVSVVAEPGVRGLFIENADEIIASYNRMGWAAANHAFTVGDPVPGYVPRDKAAEAMFEWLTTRAADGRGNLIVASHDLYIAAFLTACGVNGIGSDNWVGFMQGALLTLEGDGAWHVHWVVPNKETCHSAWVF